MKIIYLHDDKNKDEDNPNEFVLHYTSLFVAKMILNAIRLLESQTNETEFEAEYLFKRMNFYAIHPIEFTLKEFTELLEQLYNVSLLDKSYNNYKIYNKLPNRDWLL